MTEFQFASGPTINMDGAHLDCAGIPLQQSLLAVYMTGSALHVLCTGSQHATRWGSLTTREVACRTNCAIRTAAAASQSCAL